MKKLLYIVLLSIYTLLYADTPILIIHSYHESYPWSAGQDRGFRSTLDAQDNIYPSYSTEYIDSKRREFDKEYKKEFLHYLKAKYKKYTPKLIYVTDDDALNFMLEYREDFFPSVPIIFSGVNDISKKDLLHKYRCSGVFEKKDIISNIELIQKLFPKERDILFLGDNSTTVTFMQKQLYNSQSQIKEMNIESISGVDYRSTLNKLKNYRGKIVVLTTIGGFKTDDGTLVALRHVLSEVVTMRDFTVFALEDTYVKYGVIGGFLNSAFKQGEEAAKIAQKILQNKSSTLPKSVYGTNNFIFDLEALKEHKIKLPKIISEKSEFISTPPSILQKYEKLFIYTLYILITTLILGTLFFANYLYRSRKAILQREESLADMTKNMNKAQSIAHLGHWEWNIKDNTLWWSDEIYRIFGLQPQAFKATYGAFLNHVHPDDRDKVENAVAQSLQNHTDYHVVHRIVRDDNSIRYVREEGNLKLNENQEVIFMLGIIQDITETYERKQALLLQSEIFNAVQDSIMVHDMDGHFIYLNENAWKTRGYTEKEMMQMSVRELDAPKYRDDPKRVQDTFKKIQEEGHTRFQVEHLCKDGKLLPVEIYAKLISIQDKLYVLSSVRDISEQKEAQKAIESSEKKYKDLVENAIVGIYRTDLLGEILYVNPALIKMLHYDSVDEIIGENVIKMYDSAQDRENFIKLLREKGHVNNYEINARDKYDTSFPVMLSATLEGDILSGMMINMSQIKKSQAEVEKLSKVIAQIDDSVMITDKDGTISYVNQAFCNHTGYEREDLIGKTPRVFKSNHYNSSFYKNLWSSILRGEIFNETIINKKKNGELFYERKTITPLKDDFNNIVGFVSTGKDVTLETMMHKEMELLASMDKLTGIYNRHKFEELFTLEVERSRRFKTPLSLILIDIDHFKNVNDTYGHDVGDSILINLAKVVKNSIRNLDIFSRWGGEEFLILIPNTDLDQAHTLAQKLRVIVEKNDFPIAGNITISIGVSTLQVDDSFDTLFKRADNALYHAKKSGRNQVVLESEV